MKTYVYIVSFILIAFFASIPSRVHALNIAARIGDQHTEVIGGDRLYFEVEIKFPENPKRKDFRIEYQIVDGEKVLASEKVLRAVETQASFLDYIVVPKSANKGMKTLRVIIEDYETLHEEVSASFTIIKGKDQVQTYFFILLGAVVLVGFLVVVQILSINRKRGMG